MKPIHKLIFLALMFQVAYAQATMNDELAALRDSLSENAVSSVVVLRMPDDVTTRVAVTPQVLREVPSPTLKYNIEMNHSRSKLLMKWMKQATLTRTERSPDLRWGLLFVGHDGKEVASIFSDRFGRVGNVDGQNVEFSDTRLIDTIHELVGQHAH
jgi:hypothetical protein